MESEKNLSQKGTWDKPIYVLLKESVLNWPVGQLITITLLLAQELNC